MIDVRPALSHFGISDTCITAAVQDVREFVSQDGPGRIIARTNELLEKMIGTPVAAPDNDYALTVAQAVVEAVIKADGLIEDGVALLERAEQRARKFITDPAHSWMFAKPQATEATGDQRQVSTEVDVKVAVTSDGKIKKGGKEILAAALYEKHVLKAETPLDNQGFIAVLIKELGMSKAGATTYAYNMKKKLGTRDTSGAAK
jgi:hypothetical protein